MLKRSAVVACVLQFLAVGSIGALAQDQPEQARGSYAGGSLLNPSRLEDEGVGYLKLFRSRDRAYGTADLVSFLVGLGARVLDVHPEGERIQIGDLSGPRGEYISGHSSHQNGLDVDASFLRTDRREQSLQNESGFDESFVRAGKLTGNFDIDRNWTFFAEAVASGKVQRMFVDPAIKRAYCLIQGRMGPESEWQQSVVETLRRLRPYPNHDDHIHIRLYCPTGALNCRAQEEVASGSGCSEVSRGARARKRRIIRSKDEHGDEVAF